MIPYIQAAKALAFILIVGGLATALEWDGYRRAEFKYLKQIDKQKEQAKIQTDKNIALSQQIDMINASHEDEINKLHDDNLKLLNSSVRKRKVCRVPKVSSPSIASEGTVNEAELSEEFTNFLISDAFRADTVGLYAETAYNWIRELCKQDNVACANIPSNQSVDSSEDSK